jgi:hypothetical protein
VLARKATKAGGIDSLEWNPGKPLPGQQGSYPVEASLPGVKKLILAIAPFYLYVLILEIVSIEPESVNVYGAQESIPRNRFLQSRYSLAGGI